MSYLNLFVIFTVLQLLPVQAQEENILSDTLSVVFSHIFKPRAMTVSIIIKISDEENYRYCQDVLHKVMNANKDIQVPVAINEYTAITLVHYIHVKMIFTNKAENIRLHMEYLFRQNEIQSGLTKYLIILIANISLEEKLNEMHAIFDDFFNFYIIDVAILVYVDDFLHIYTYKPYDMQHCAFTKPILMHRFSKAPLSIHYDDLFPFKLKNFHQCPIKVVLWNVPPFVELQWQNNKIVQFYGHDAKILKNLAEFLNFSIDVVPNEPPNFLSGDVYRNMTAVGVFKMLLERRANLTLGSISCLSRRLQLSTGSVPYFVSELIIVFKNSQKYTSFQLLLRPFQKSTWLLFFTILILRPLLKRLLSKHAKSYDTLQNLFRIQWLFLIFLLRASYEGSMFQAIRNSPYQALPKTINEVVEQNYTLVTDYAIARIIRDISSLKNITKVVNTTQIGMLESLDNLPYKTGVISYDTFVAMFMKSRQSNHSNYAIVRDKITNTIKCMYFPRLSFMTAPVNYFIKRFSQFGIFNKYSKALGYENLPHTTDRLRDSCSNSNTQTPLDFEFLWAVFSSVLILHSLAIVIFILELLSVRFQVLRILRNCKILNKFNQ